MSLRYVWTSDPSDQQTYSGSLVDDNLWTQTDADSVEESISDSISVGLGICNPGAIANNDLVVAVQR